MKYRNKIIEAEDGRFGSLKEYYRWEELKLMQRAGAITDLKRQVPFELIPSQKVNGRVVERAVKYIADFTYIQNGEYIVEDCKGMKTDVYKLKKKLMLHKYGIRVKES